MVGVDWPMKAPSMHIQKHKSLIREKLSKFSQLSFCQKLFFRNQTPSCICSMCLHCIRKVSNCSIRSCGKSLSACVWPIIYLCIYKSTKALLGKNCLSSHSCHFVKNYFFRNQTPSCICSMCPHCIRKVSNCSIRSCGKS